MVAGDCEHLTDLWFGFMARANNFFLIFVSIFKEKLVYKGLI
jgi:hypothetical protein